MNIKTKLFLITLFFSFTYGQKETNSNEVRSIRLENFKNNYKGQTIRFTDQNSRVVEGVLMEITNTDFVMSINNSAAFYSHENVDFVYLPPVSEDFYITASISILGGIAGYVATIIAHPYPNKGALGAVSTLGTVLGFIVGKNTFYKPQKINISGRLRG
tara:strand:+ start:658 stop:1134 length:477 start_codon:yes stop_codon:yes gene_type:complete